MKAFTWDGGAVRQGLALTQDERLGQVVFLGEEGRGRRYEKVALGKRNPAEVVNGRVLEAHPVKITLPVKDGKPERVFFVLEKPRSSEDGVLVRICTLTSYIRGANGRYVTVEGKPETLIAGFGAFGDAGRIGSWADGLVVMRPCDVLRVYPSRGECSYALWLDADGVPTTVAWKDYENIRAVAKAEAMVAKAAEIPETLDVIFGQMRVFTFSGGEVTKGLRISDGATGKVVALGEEGRGRALTEVPLIGLTPIVQKDKYDREEEIIEQAAVAKLDEKTIPARYGWGDPTIKKIYGLTQASKSEEGAFLVRVCTSYGYTRRGDGKWETWKGNPSVVTGGHGADGGAGRIGDWTDDLLVLREGDVLFVRPSGDGPGYALFVHGGQVCSQEWTSWKIADAKADPMFYVGKGLAPWGHVPAEWIGSVVIVLGLGERTMVGNKPTPAFEEEQTGELISVSPDRIVLNLGWDGRDRHDVEVRGGLFVQLYKDKQHVHRLEGEEAEKRKLIRTEAEELRDKAVTATKQSYFCLALADLRRDVERVAEEQGLDTKPTDGEYDSLFNWVEMAKKGLAKFIKIEPELKTLEQCQNSGEILVDFSAWHRRGGATNQGDGWVVLSDGSLRDPDERRVPRFKTDGTYVWRLVGPEELAISFSKACTAAPHEFVVNKLPLGGCTAEQVATAECLGREIASVGGWDLCKKFEPEPTPEESAEKIDPSRVDLSKLFSGGATVRRGRGDND